MTAFLLLAIVPLALLSFLTYRQIQADTGQKLVASLETIVELKEAHLVDWVGSYERELALLAAAPELGVGSPARQAEFLAARLAAFHAADPTLQGLIVIDEDGGDVVAAPDSARAVVPALQPELAGERRLLLTTGTPDGDAGPDPILAVSYRAGARWVVGLLDWEALQGIVSASDGQAEGMSTWLVTAGGLAASAGGLSRLAVDAGKPGGTVPVLAGQSVSGTYTGLDGVPVYGAYRWIPVLGAGLLAEYPQTAALAAGNAVTAMVVGATLGVALITAAIAAVVTRRLTVPIVQLTETAAWMARGDLNQNVAVTRSDEIGVLARAFNRMAAELRALYGDLEDKVAERTRQLEEAHRRTRYYAMQLSISAEVARIASSIRSLDDLLPTVVKLIGDAFELHQVAIYLLDSNGQRAIWKAGSNGLVPSEEEVVGGLSLVGQVAADGQRRVLRVRAASTAGQDPSREADAVTMVPPLFAYEMAVPLRAGKKLLGVLLLQKERADELDANDEMVFQSLADQISIAIENARVYGMEQARVQRLRDLDRMQSEFLTNMSHALRTPLNSIIGFSRIMLKELDGPLTDVQRTDLGTIYKSGRQLLGLMNDMFDLSQLELGTAVFSVTEVNLAEIVEGVMATAGALAMGKPVRLTEEVSADLPVLHTDGQRVRQLILALLANAIKFTGAGGVSLRVAAGEDGVVIRVVSTGVEISPAELESLFADGRGDDGAGEGDVPEFGLAISRRVVERLGGRIWVETQGKEGVVLAFSLPSVKGA